MVPPAAVTDGGGARVGVTTVAGSNGRAEHLAASASTMASSGGAKLTVGRISLVNTAADIACIALMALSVLSFDLWGQPFERGFFCDDDSIRFSHKVDTISATALVCVAVLLPVAVVLGCEGWAWWREGPAGRARRICVGAGRLSMPLAAARVSWALLAFVFGLGAEQAVVDMAKFSVGRLRPHFLDACKPQPSLAQLCSNASSDHLYVTAFRCTGVPAVVRQARLSFPSGHSSMSFYAAVFTVLFLETRFRWRRRIRLPVAFVQLVLVLMAWFTALSRVSDHMHHWSDVLSGGAIGSLAAVLTILHFLRRRGSKGVSLGDTTYVFGMRPADPAADAFRATIVSTPTITTLDIPVGAAA